MDRAAPLSRLPRRMRLATAISALLALLGTYLVSTTDRADAAPVANVIRVAEFPADCTYSHRLPDDPIVFPGLPGASHMHSFFGSTVTNANTTLPDLVRSTSTCNPQVDVSSY